jgi:hypothetical protein
MPHHVDRSKLYVMQRIEAIAPLDHQRIADAIEGTRFPPRAGQQYGVEASILRAADFIGQLGDPNYLRKANALYHEFEEVGTNRQLGYESPADIVNRYPQFYWDMGRRISRWKSAISTRPRADGSGSPTSMAMCSAPNATSRCPDRSGSDQF